MNEILTQLFEKQKVTTPSGEEQTLHSCIDREEAKFIAELIEKYNVSKTLEVGCAMGVSSLVICEAIAKNSADAHHIIIDPYQRTEWKNIGIHQLQKAGYDHFDLIEEPSEFALPKLVQGHCRIDFAFIDGWHTFDHTLLDFFYINRLLQPGGILVVDDVRMPSVKKVMRMIQTYPAYRYMGGVNVNYSRKLKALEAAKAALRPFARLLGRRLSQELVDASVLHSDSSLGLNASVVAFKKVAEDQRPWNWFENF